VRSELRREYQVDTSDLPRWISGEKPRMRVDTWERLKPILEQFAVSEGATYRGHRRSANRTLL